MKNKLLKLRRPYFFRQRSPGKDASGHMPELVRTEPEWGKNESVIRDILRWADDGGKMLDLGSQKDKLNPDAAWAPDKE